MSFAGPWERIFPFVPKRIEFLFSVREARLAFMFHLLIADGKKQFNQSLKQLLPDFA